MITSACRSGLRVQNLNISVSRLVPGLCCSRTMVRVAVGQITSTEDVAHNLKISVQLAREAAAAGAKSLFLPEAADFITVDAHTCFLFSKPLSKHTYTLGLQAAAKELGIYIAAGIHELPEEDEHDTDEEGSERVYNTHVAIGPDGEIKSVYRKLHLFDVQLKASLRADAPALNEKSLSASPPKTGESSRIRPGHTIQPPVDFGEAGKVGLEICYDIRFPELHIILRRKGADIIAVPSAFTLKTGKDHWYTLVRSLAINYQVYVVAPAQAGAHSPLRSSWGESLVFDPWGVELGRLPSIDESEDRTKPMPSQLIITDVDPEIVRSVREQIPLDIQKRTDVYGVVGPDAFRAEESATGEPGWIEWLINRFTGRAKSDNKTSNSGGVSEKK